MRSMKIPTLLLGLAALLTIALPACAGGAAGEPAPDFKLKGADGKTYSLADFKGKTVVLEWVNPNEKTMSDLAKQHGEVVWLGINSTNPSHPNYLEPAETLAYNRKNGINYTVLYDETGSVGKAYGAKTTPHMFIIGKDGKIDYNGAIDDDPPGRKAKAERANYVAAGLSAEKGGKNPDPATTKPYGCSVKY
jgi:peroxiredoxin